MQGYSSTYVNSTYIVNSYSTMETNGSKNIGGIVGTMRYSTIRNTYTIGKVIGNSNVGGVVRRSQ